MIQEIAITDVIPADYNPPHRTSPRYIQDLVKSLGEYGQIVPCIVVKDGSKWRLVDGHRRHAALLANGQTTIIARVAEDAAIASAWYAEVNNASKRLTGKDKLAVYLKNPEAVDTVTRAAFDEWSKPTLRKVQKLGGSLATLNQARRVADYAGVNYDVTVVWLLTNGMTYKARTAMEMGIPCDILASAITGNRPIRQAWEVA